MNINELVSFFKQRKESFASTIRPRLRRALWSMWRSDEQDVVKLKELARSGRRIEAMEQCKSCGGWGDVLEARAYYSALYDAATKNVNASEKDRLVAAASWSAIEGFFTELKLRKKVGQEAYLKLRDARENL